MIKIKKKKYTYCLVPKNSVLEIVHDRFRQEYPAYCNLLHQAVHRLKVILFIQLLDM